MKKVMMMLMLVIPMMGFGQQKEFIYVLEEAGDVERIRVVVPEYNRMTLRENLDIFISYDPMNWGEAVDYEVAGRNPMIVTFPAKYGAHARFLFKHAVSTLQRPEFFYREKQAISSDNREQPWRDATLPVEERVELVLKAMTPADKMELLREGWGIPGIPHLGLPFMNKVEALHGYSYGSGATIFPQSIALAASWDKKLVERVAEVIGEETRSANTLQAWSPVLDVAQDARWGRVEESYGEDPVLVSKIGGAWIRGFQSLGLLTTPKHFGVHGAPLGGRDSHDIGLSEREIREIHLVPFRNIIKEYDCQAVMMSYNDYLGVPVAQSKELLHNILREEWGFSGYIVSDCGAIGNLTARKHYTAVDYVEAANLALAAGIATNCGDVYKDEAVIRAAEDGRIDMENLDNVCRSMLRVIFANGLFEDCPSKPLDWDKVYPGWNSPAHQAVARQAAREAIVLLENKNRLLPLDKGISNIAVIGPGADDLQPGDYTQRLQPGQLRSVLTGIREAVSPETRVHYEKGCEFFARNYYDLDAVMRAVDRSDVVVMVLGDCSTSENYTDMVKTSGENHDLATLVLPGFQQDMLEKVCESGKPVILVLQAGRPYNLSFAAEHASAILVNWLPGQEGGPATADVLFGDYSPAGRLPISFPRHVGQLPHYYNFKTSGRRYEYADMEFYPLYRFGYGLSYSQFDYTGLKSRVNADGTVSVEATVRNTGNRKSDEVVQLYVTDLYASVKTRVMELKDFERITLDAGESRQVSFTLTPYDLSLLNVSMDRVTEEGEFLICVGGSSPTYEARDRIKDSVGYKSRSEGLSMRIDYPYNLKANFELSYVGIEDNLSTGKRRVAVRVRNTGSMTDTGKINLFVNGVKQEETHHFELDPLTEKVIYFDIAAGTKGQLSFATKYRLESTTI